MAVIDDIRADREDLARVLKKHVGIRKIVEDLYPDSSHFIYELLQNAEDAGATEACFKLSDGDLGFEHDGRPFNPDDIRAITDIGEGTKDLEEDKIGRFGVGFKAVFAYCETPHIWSPTFSFKITDLVLPSAIRSRPDLDRRTRFEFPFNNPKKDKQVAKAEIEKRLDDLAETTLLFLRHLESIRWQIGDSLERRVWRVRHSANHVEVKRQLGNKTVSSGHFLRFDQPAKGLEKQQVAIAFVLDFLPNVTEYDHKKPFAKQLRIVPASPGRVAVYFPAEKETSGLRFHLHAPFVPELSRASVKETEVNQPLFQQLAALAAASLHEVRSLGLLVTDFLAVVPNPQDAIQPRYHCLRSAVVQEMNMKALTPTYAKSHAPANQLLQGRASLKELLSPADLKVLFDADERHLEWAVGATQKNSNVDRFLNGLAITDWDVDEFVTKLYDLASEGRRLLLSPPRFVTDPDPEFMKWLSGKSLDWHQALYGLLGEFLSNVGSQKDTVLQKMKEFQIVRVTDGTYSVGSECYWPNEVDQRNDVLPRVARGVYTSGKSTSQREGARLFLEAIGVRPVGEAEQVEALLKERYTASHLSPALKDIKRFIALVEQQPDKADLFAGYLIFKRKDGDDPAEQMSKAHKHQ